MKTTKKKCILSNKRYLPLAARSQLCWHPLDVFEINHRKEAFIKQYALVAIHSNGAGLFFLDIYVKPWHKLFKQPLD